MAQGNKPQQTILYRSLSKVNMRREQSVAAFTAALKAANLDPRHDWIFSRVADSFGIDVTKVEDYVMKAAHLSLVNNFFNKDGQRKLLWYYQSIDVDTTDDAGKREGPKRLFLTTGDDSALRGQCCYFIRIEDCELTKENMNMKVITGTVKGDMLLRSLQETLEHVMIPALSARPDWGEIGREDEKVSLFLEQVGRFVEMLDGVTESLEGAVVLRAPDHRLNIESKPAAFQQAATDPELVHLCEELVDDWCKDIDRVLAESDQVRKEDDNIGPNAELAHWKGRMAKFNAITDQLKASSHVRIVIGVLQAAKSKRLEQWKALHNRITDAANESKDNVKYLYTLERFSEPLYKSDPVQMVEAIPGLINAIKMMHAIARYYNTSERMTALFVKITNQMITRCKSYINENGNLWDQDRSELIRRFQACIALNNAYQDAFHKTKQRLETQPKEPQFDFSEIYIFGKFNAFCERIQKLIDMFEIVRQFSALEESSIEGMDEVLRQFNAILVTMKTKHYDLLDHRRQEFNNDYIEFYEQIIELEHLLQELISVSFEPITSTERALALLNQFRSVLHRQNLRAELENKYHMIFSNYGRELDTVRKIYEKHGKAPPVPRDTPPYAGAIAWARQLLRRIEQPMKLFQEHQHILHTQEARKTIKVYNKLATALVTFETMYHQQWCRKVPEVKEGLQATLLVYSTEAKKTFVNFDPLIVQLIRETKAMQRMDLPVPEVAQLMCLQEEKYKEHFNSLQFMLAEYDRITNKLAPSAVAVRTSSFTRVHQLLGPRFDAVKRKIEPGLTTLLWTSLNIGSYIKEVHEALDALEALVDKARDIINFRADGILLEMQRVELFTPVRDSLWTVDEFIAQAEEQSTAAAAMVDAKGLTVETAIRDLISLITDGYTSEELSKVESFMDYLFKEYANHCSEAVKDCCKNSLERIKKHMGVQPVVYGLSAAAKAAPAPAVDSQPPLFSVDVVLQHPNIAIIPTLETLQETMPTLSNIIQGSTKLIYQWGQDRSDPPAGGLKNYYLEVSNNKDVIKLSRELGSAFAQIRVRVQSFLQQFDMYKFLWQAKKQDTYDEFAANSPTIDDFEAELQKFSKIEAEVTELERTHEVLALTMNTAPLISTLVSEAQAWKQLFGDNLKVRSQRDMQVLLDGFEESTIKLNRQVNDLDEIRQVMKVLKDLREAESAIDMRIDPIEETYALLNRYSIRYSKEEAESADNLRYSWKKLKTLATEKQSQLLEMEPGFRKELTAALSEFDQDLAELTHNYAESGPMAPGIKPRVAVERLRAFQRLAEERERKRVTYNGGEELFGLPVTTYPQLDRIQNQLDLLEKLYGLYSDVIVTVNGYEDILWAELNLDVITTQVRDFQDRCRRLPKQMKDWEAYLELKKTIDDFDTLMPLLESMGSKAVQQRHWDQIAEVTGHTFKLDPETFKLKHLLQAPLLEFQDEIHEICYGARGEADVEAKLRQIQDEWSDCNFEFAAFKQRGNITLAGDKTSEIMQAVDESLMSLQSLMSNRNNKPFKAEIQMWMVKLNTCLREIDNWIFVQSLWIYLEAVFMSGDISRAMPVEAKRFANVDKQWVKIMNSVIENPNVVAFVYNDETLRNILPHLKDMLEMCRSSLNGYLQSKQSLFPRFYFLSPPALLEVLGQANSNSHAIQPHLSSIFANINSVKFSQTEYDRITHMVSQEGETVELAISMECDGTVETWLNTLVDAMRKTVRHILQRGARSLGGQDFKQFAREEKAQVGLLGLQLMWTEQCEDALCKASKDSSVMKMRDKANWRILEQLMSLTIEDLDPMTRVKVETLVTIHLHQCEVFRKLVSKHIKSAEDFEWQRQSRFYWRAETGDCVMRITENELPYCYEYLGCTDRLAITPLTDRCYITLASALGMSLGGAPAGPAGTGKTETVKDMGKSLGKYVVVFNCSPEHEYEQMEMIFKGIAMSGCWGDFDEFNRIKLPVLSVCAQQISTIFQAKRDGATKFLYTDGNKIALDKECGIFITMNPGYAGRQELPENLKLLFRTVAMMVPERDIIMEVKLASAGFLKCKELAIKFFWLYKLCEEQLSNQRHYDFGLRNILSVLRTCGKVKRESVNQSESMILQRVCHDMNLSKLVDDDYALFLSLISDLFKNDGLETSAYPELQSAISVVCERNGLDNQAAWNLKLIQLYETSQVRWGITVLGPSGAGKTACITTLLAALNETGHKYKEVRMNPKAINPEQYLGMKDPKTTEWKDGVFSALWRKYNGALKKAKNDNLWLTMDGPIDSLWIESLNTVLDDNKTLTLPNGDRLAMANNLKLVFEVDSVANASPATVSRTGMIYMSDKSLGWEPVYNAWSKGQPAALLDVLTPLFQQTFNPLLGYIKERLKEVMSVPIVNHIRTCLDLLTGLLPDSGTTPSALHVKRAFTWCLAWAMGGLLDEADGRRKLHIELQNHPALDLPTIAEDSDDTLYDYLVTEKGEWAHWDVRVPVYKYPQDHVPPFYEVLVPTVASVRQEFLVHLVAKQGKSVLLVGESGTAKTVGMLEYLKKQDSDLFVSKTINFSSATHPNLFQQTIENSVQKAHGLTWRPVGQKRMMVFIDDISMPEINEHGDQPTNEIVRQLMEQEGFYSLEKPGDFMLIKDLQFLAAMFHPGGGRNDIPSRLKRQFACFNATIPTAHSIDTIFSTIVTGYFSDSRGFHRDVTLLAPKIIPLTRKLWMHTKERMLPTPEHFHYIFNLRDLSRITEGLIDVIPEVISSPKQLFMLWRHECERVMADKLSNQEDKKWFASAFEKILSDEVGSQMASDVMEPFHFVDFMRDEPEVDMEGADANVDLSAPKIFEPVKSLSTLRARIDHFLGQYNSVRGQNLDLVLFDDCIKHIVRVSRIIRRPRGHALLVGVGGSGKQSVTKLAAFIAGQKIKQLRMTRAYNLNNFVEDLVELFKTTGQLGHPTTFIFTDNDVKSNAFLEYVNSILTSGEVSGIIAKDELEAIYGELRPLLRAERPNSDGTTAEVHKYFIERSRSNLHVVLCFSPVGERFRSRALRFPGLISGCTINWFESWPKDALVAVAEKHLNVIHQEKTLVCSRDVKQAMIQFMCNVHFGVETVTQEYFSKLRRHVYVTPKSYLNFINSYIAVYTSKKKEIDSEAARMQTGLAALADAGIAVAKMQDELNIKKARLATAQEVAAKALAEIQLSTHEAQKEAEKVEKIKDAVMIKRNDAMATAAEAAIEVEKARPIYERALSALQTISPKDINELRAGNNPVLFTQRVLECVRILRYLPLDPVQYLPELDNIKTSWSLSSVMIKRPDFMTSMTEYAKEELNGEVIEMLEAYWDTPGNDFGKDSGGTVTGEAKAKTINMALVGVFMWIEAIMEYYYVSQDREPKIMAQKRAERRLQIAEEELAAKQAILDEKQAEVRQMQCKYEEAMANKQRLLEDAQQTERTMLAASQLIEGLAEEKIRWSDKSKTFGDTVQKLVGDVAVATAFLGYAGPFNQEYRTSLIQGWCRDLSANSIPFNRNVNVISLLADDATVGRWNIEGLPTDDQSVQNGIIVGNSSRRDARFPLLIDPQGQGHAWISNREAANHIKRVKLDSRMFKDDLENAVVGGTPLLIEHVGEELDPLLDGVLEKGYRSGKNYLCRIGDKEVMIHPNFKLYITTKFPNPRYPPEVFAKVSIIDFAVTMGGLEDQLLGRVIRAEKEELEQQRTHLLQEVNSNKKQIKDLEDLLLTSLTTESNVSLVENTELISVLRNTKRTSEEVQEKLAVAEETNKKISAAREEYRPVATRGSILYFLLAEMQDINPMYQSSLQQFLGVFDKSIEMAAKSHNPKVRIELIVEQITYNAYIYVARGLFERHKILFLLQLALKIDMQAKRVELNEYRIFIKGGSSIDQNTVKKRPEDVPKAAWLNLAALSDVPLFYDILNQVDNNREAWIKWSQLDAPEDLSATIPDGYQDRLGPFHRLVLVRCWREDRMFFAAQAYIEKSMGKKYITPLGDGLESAFTESDARTPIVCLLSLGSDPVDNVRAMARKLKLSPPLEVSMGQGQEATALRLLGDGMQGGTWVILQNAHLGIQFLEEQLVPMLRTRADMDPDFRLWITSEPLDEFPISLLQMSIKVTNEPPQGMKAGLLKSFSNHVTQDMLDRVDRQEWRPILFSVCFMYSVLQERRKFGPMGWCVQYEFNQADLVACVNFLESHFFFNDTKKFVEWKNIRFMVCEVHYGGRVTDEYDRRLLSTYGKRWLSQEVANTAQPFMFAPNYPMPVTKTMEGYLEYIANMKDYDSPEIFGLNPNADIAYRSAQTQSILDTILAVQPKEGAGTLMSRDATVEQLADAYVDRLPPDYVESALRDQIEVLKGFTVPLNIFLFQEVQRFQKVVSKVREDLQNLKLALNGIRILSEDLSDIANALFDGRVPKQWETISWKSANVGNWMTSLEDRYKQYDQWLKQDRPAKFWLAGFFNPQGFLTAVLQEYARTNEQQLTLDLVMPKATVAKKDEHPRRLPPGEGVYIYGLTLEGARWDRKGRNGLMDLTTKERHCEMPPILFTGEARHDMDEESQYKCPVYITPSRTDAELITEIYLPSSQQHPDFWTLRGVALLASTL